MATRVLASVERICEAHLPEVGGLTILVYAALACNASSPTESFLIGSLTGGLIVSVALSAVVEYDVMATQPLFFRDYRSAVAYAFGVDVESVPSGIEPLEDIDLFVSYPGATTVWAWTTSPHPAHYVTREHVPILVDLAKSGDEPLFRDLALTLGVKSEHLDELWAVTVARVSRDKREVS